MGLFDDPYVDPDEAERIVGMRRASRSWRCRRRARRSRCSRTTATCCRSTLGPLKTIAVIGPNANRSLLGGYSGVPKHDVTVLEGIRERVGDRAKVVYSEGCKITLGGSWNADEVVRERSRRRSQADRRGGRGREAGRRDRAGDRRQRADVARSVEPASTWATARASICIGRQNELVDAMVATGKPVVALLFNGRPLSITCARRESAGDSRMLVSRTGERAAPSPRCCSASSTRAASCRSPIPRSAGHLPAFYNHKPSARRGYLFDDVSPLYPFGFGLSYTTFRMSNVRLDRRRGLRPTDRRRVRVDVTNTGTARGHRSGADVHPRSSSAP